MSATNSQTLQETFAHFDDPRSIIEDINRIGHFLAMPQLLPPFPGKFTNFVASERADLLVLLGNSVLQTVEAAANAWKKGLARHLLIAGGKGHSTKLLRQTVQQDHRYDGFPLQGLSEAEIIGELLFRWHGIDHKGMLLETNSTNCGANAEYSYRLLREEGLNPQDILLFQDPTMQRRTHASFRRVWPDEEDVYFLSCPSFIPELILKADTPEFQDKEISGLWPVERYISLVMGEIPRLRDNEEGYGPRGKGFIAHVDIPDEVMDAYRRIVDPLRHYVRTS